MSSSRKKSFIDFNLDTKIDKVIYTNLILDNMVGNVVVRNPKVDMTNLRMNIMGGTLTIQIVNNAIDKAAESKK